GLIRCRYGEASRTIHERSESVEKVTRVVGAGGRLWVVLDRERPQSSVSIGELQTLDTVLVQTDVAYLGDAVRRLMPLSWLGRNGEPMIVRGDLHLAGGEVHHRLINSAMAVTQLEGPKTEGPPEELVAEADTEVRNPGCQHGLQKRNLSIRCRRIARSVREEHSVRTKCLDLGQRAGRRYYMNLKSTLGHPCRSHRLNAKVHRHD